MKDTLKLIQSITKKRYFSEFKAENILALSIDKHELPFAFIILEEAHLLLSFNLECNESFLAADLALLCADVNNTSLAEEFFITEKGVVLFGEEAHLYFEKEVGNMLLNTPPISNAIN